MEITGTQTIPASPQKVWDALNDPDILRKCLPGCEKVEHTSADAFQVVMRAAVGPLRARFNGKLQLTEAHPPSDCVMVFEGQGGAVGFGKGTSSIKLTPKDEGTELRYAAQAQVGGKLAQVGSRLIDGVARKMSDDFFNELRKQLTGEGAPEARPETKDVPRSPRSRGEGRGEGPTVEPAFVSTAPETVVARAPAAAPATVPAATTRPADATHHILVPGWWLAVAAVIGSATTLAGALLLR